jgi:hypothetical protein
MRRKDCKGEANFGISAYGLCLAAAEMIGVRTIGDVSDVYNSDHLAYHPAPWRSAHMAIQPRLGILPQRHRRIAADRHRRARPHGQTLRRRLPRGTALSFGTRKPANGSRGDVGVAGPSRTVIRGDKIVAHQTSLSPALAGSLVVTCRPAARRIRDVAVSRLLSTPRTRLRPRSSASPTATRPCPRR